MGQIRVGFVDFHLLLTCCAIYFIWIERNNRKFGHNASTSSSVRAKIVKTVKFKLDKWYCWISDTCVVPMFPDWYRFEGICCCSLHICDEFHLNFGSGELSFLPWTMMNSLLTRPFLLDGPRGNKGNYMLPDLNLCRLLSSELVAAKAAIS